MHIFVTGATGFVGTRLIAHLIEQGHDVTAVGRKPASPFENAPGLAYLQADPTRPGDWQEVAARAGAIVNLAGQSIFHLWTQNYKQAIYDSRVLTTRNLVEALPENQESLLISTSAAGYYGDRGDDELDESAAPGDDFLARVCRDWEVEAEKASTKGVRVVETRFGVVLGAGGGAMKQMLPIFKLGLGGPLGNGRHWFPWIHILDLVRAIEHLISTPDVHGPVNFTAPEAVRHKTFAKTLGRSLGRPAFMPAPGFMVRLLLGQLGDAFLSSQRVIPRKLLSSGFAFDYASLEAALTQIISDRSD